MNLNLEKLLKLRTNLNFDSGDYMVQISVLIPVYNASEYLSDSISSILNQSFKDIELICVNDGSKDNSLSLLNDFAANDSRVKVIDKENGGCGSARNRALEEAKGEYVYFFDPDDIVEENALELAYASAIKNNSDLVIFKANIFDSNGISNKEVFFYYDKTINENKFDNLSFEDIKQYVLKGGYAPWSKLYKKELLDSYDDFKFDLGIAFDDVPFHVKSMIRAKKISFVNEYLYHYRVDNVNSVNSTASNGFDIFKIINIVEDILRKENCFEVLKKEFYFFNVVHILLYILNTNSAKYYGLAREKFLKIDKKYIEDNPDISRRYDLVISYENYDDFKIPYELLLTINDKNSKINLLKKEVSSLKKKNKKLKEENKLLSKSKSNNFIGNIKNKLKGDEQ